jgi:hypothetical protein
MGLKKMSFTLVLSLIVLVSCIPVTTSPTQTVMIPVSQEPSPTIKPQASSTQTLLPTFTTIAATNTSTPTPDFSQIQLIGAHAIQGKYGSFTLVILDVGSLQGDFYGLGDGQRYKCEFRLDITTQIDCKGPSAPYNKQINFSLFASSHAEPVFKTNYNFSGILPTPIGMYCEIEPLWTEVLHYQGDVGCYAVTCWVNGTYYGGVEDSCKEYWPWIPPGLFPTALPTNSP